MDAADAEVGRASPDRFLWILLGVGAANTLLDLSWAWGFQVLGESGRSLAFSLLLALGVVAPRFLLPGIRRPQERWFWLSWSGALGVLLLVEVVRLAGLGTDRGDPGAVLLDLLYAFFYLFVLLSLHLRPDRDAGPGGVEGAHPLEIVGSTAFVLFLLGYFVLVPLVVAPWDYDTWVPSMTLYVILDGFIAFRLLHLRKSSPSEDWRILYSWFLIAAALWAVTDALELVDIAGFGSKATLGIWEVLADLPWLLVAVAARLRAAPRPAWFARDGGQGVDLFRDHAGTESGWMVLAAFVLPAAHFGSEMMNVFDPASRSARDGVVLASLLILLTLAFLHQRSLEARAWRLLQEKRRQEEERALLAAAVEQSDQGILIADDLGLVRYANHAAALQWQGDEDLPGTALPIALSHLEPTVADEPLAVAIARGISWEGRGRARGGTGEGREELVSVFPVKGQAGEVTHFVAVSRDVTVLAWLERQEGRSRRMEALARLAGGTAHEFNNVLAIIVGHGELIDQELPAGAPAREDVEAIRQAAMRAGSLVDQILAFSQAGIQEQRCVPLTQVLRESVVLLQASVPPTVDLKQRVEAGVGDVLGDPLQLQRAILNLGMNGIQAMEGRSGTLEISARRLGTAPDGGVRSPGGWACVSLRDTGVGMDARTRERAFEPFFTTRPVGMGSGLGLSAVHGIVTAHGGEIRLESELGSGTTVTVLLPLARAGGAAAS